MTINYDDALALIEAKDQAHDQYNGARRALENAMWEAREAHDPQPGEVWRVFLPYHSHFVKAAIPAIKTARGWITHPGYCGGHDLTDAEEGYLTDLSVFPLGRELEASPIEGEEE